MTKSHDELIRYGKAGVFNRNLFLHTAFRLIKQGAQLDASRVSLLQDFNQIRKRIAGIDDVFHDQYILSLDRFIQILYEHMM